MKKNGTTKGPEDEPLNNPIEENTDAEDFDGDMEDIEDLDEFYRPPCMYCESEDGCEHLLFDIDLINPEFNSGRFEDLDRLSHPVSEIFLYLLKNKVKAKFGKKEVQETLLDLWVEAKDTFTPGDDYFYFSMSLFYQLLEDIIASDIENEQTFTHRYVCGGGAGSGESPVSLCYAKNPDAVISLIPGWLNHYLKPFTALAEEFRKRQAPER